MSQRIAAFAVVGLAIIGVLSVYLYSGNREGDIVARGPGSASKEDATKAGTVHNSSPSIHGEVVPMKALGHPEKGSIAPSPADIRERLGYDLARNVADRFAKAIKGLNLNPEDEQKILSLLVEREAVVYEARAVLRAEERENIALYRKVVAAAQAEVEKQISAGFPQNVSGKILKMVDASRYLQIVNERVEPALAHAGVPLASEQVFPLLEIFYETYDRDISSDFLYVRENVNPNTGLTDLDELALARARFVLSPEQLRELRTAIVERNNVIIKKQVSS